MASLFLRLGRGVVVAGTAQGPSGLSTLSRTRDPQVGSYRDPCHAGQVPEHGGGRDEPRDLVRPLPSGEGQGALDPDPLLVLREVFARPQRRSRTR